MIQCLRPLWWTHDSLCRPPKCTQIKCVNPSRFSRGPPEGQSIQSGTSFGRDWTSNIKGKNSPFTKISWDPLGWVVKKEAVGDIMSETYSISDNGDTCFVNPITSKLANGYLLYLIGTPPIGLAHKDLGVMCIAMWRNMSNSCYTLLHKYVYVPHKSGIR